MRRCVYCEKAILGKPIKVGGEDYAHKTCLKKAEKIYHKAMREGF